jgi:hypothetical protein
MSWDLWKRHVFSSDPPFVPAGRRVVSARGTGASQDRKMDWVPAEIGFVL